MHLERSPERIKSGFNICHLWKFIIPLLEGFHTIKIIQACDGKYLEGSGIDQIFAGAGTL